MRLNNDRNNSKTSLKVESVADNNSQHAYSIGVGGGYGELPSRQYRSNSPARIQDVLKGGSILGQDQGPLLLRKDSNHTYVRDQQSYLANSGLDVNDPATFKR